MFLVWRYAWAGYEPEAENLIVTEKRDTAVHWLKDRGYKRQKGGDKNTLKNRETGHTAYIEEIELI